MLQSRETEGFIVLRTIEKVGNRRSWSTTAAEVETRQHRTWWSKKWSQNESRQLFHRIQEQIIIRQHKCLFLTKTTNSLPLRSIETNHWENIKKLQMSDLELKNQSSNNLLAGAASHNYLIINKRLKQTYFKATYRSSIIGGLLPAKNKPKTSQ